MKNNHSEFEIDILSLLKKLWTKKFLILLFATLFATISLVVSLFFIKPSYVSTTRIYVVNQKNSDNLSAQDLQAGDYLVKDYKEIITSNDVLESVVETEKLNISPGALAGKISVSIPANTRVISISVKDHDPKIASDLANAVREIAAEKIKHVTKVDDVTVLEAAKPMDEPSSPNIKRNTILGFLVGGFLAVITILISEILDDRVKRPEDVEEVLNMTLLGIVPDTKKL